jgi:hypothetical protein
LAAGSAFALREHRLDPVELRTNRLHPGFQRVEARPPTRLRFSDVTHTPAMQAGIFDRALTWRSVFAWPVRPLTSSQHIESELAQSQTSRHNQRFVPTSRQSPWPNLARFDAPLVLVPP